MKLILGLHTYRFLNELCKQCVKDNNRVSCCFSKKLLSFFVARSSNCTKILFPDKCFQVFLYGALLACDKSHWISPRPSWLYNGFTTVKNTTYLPVLRLTPPGIKPCMISLLTSILFRFRREKYSRWNLLVKVHCLAMRNWLYFLKALGLREDTSISENSSGSSNIETFSYVLHLSPEMISICQLTNTELWQIASSFRKTNIVYRLIAFSCIHQ